MFEESTCGHRQSTPHHSPLLSYVPGAGRCGAVWGGIRATSEELNFISLSSSPFHFFFYALCCVAPLFSAFFLVSSTFFLLVFLITTEITTKNREIFTFGWGGHRSFWSNVHEGLFYRRLKENLCSFSHQHQLQSRKLPHPVCSGNTRWIQNNSRCQWVTPPTPGATSGKQRLIGCLRKPTWKWKHKDICPVCWPTYCRCLTLAPSSLPLLWLYLKFNHRIKAKLLLLRQNCSFCLPTLM